MCANGRVHSWCDRRKLRGKHSDAGIRDEQAEPAGKQPEMKRENDSAISTLTAPGERAAQSEAATAAHRPWVERAIVAFFALLIVYSAVRSVYGAKAKAFWNDEVYTAIVTRQPNVATIWRALKDGADGQPPLFYLVERAADKLVPNREIAFRVPSILAFCVLMWCMFAWLRRRYGALVAAAAGMIPLLTMLYDSFAVEARPYALLIACLSVALCCYQRAPKAGWTIGLGLSLTLAQAFHYYALLAIAPFVAAEAVFWLKTRWLRGGVWAALACPLVPLIAFWPLISAVKREYGGPHYWAQPTVLPIFGFYNWLFQLPPMYARDIPNTAGNIGIACAFWAIAVCAISVLVWRGLRARPENDASFHEPILMAGLLAMPIVVYATAKIAHGSETERYMLAAALGIAMAFGYALSRMRRRLVLVVGALLLLCVGAQETNFWIPLYLTRELGPPQSVVKTLIRKAGHPELPVVVSEGLNCLSLAYYETPNPSRRLVGIADPELAVKYTDFDTLDKNLLVLRPYTPLRIYDFESFQKEYPVFLLYARTSGKYYQDWWPRYLAQQGYSMQTLATHEATSVYLVDLTKAAAEKRQETLR